MIEVLSLCAARRVERTDESLTGNLGCKSGSGRGREIVVLCWFSARSLLSVPSEKERVL
jgi:hypothetical protein